MNANYKKKGNVINFNSLFRNIFLEIKNTEHEIIRLESIKKIYDEQLSQINENHKHLKVEINKELEDQKEIKSKHLDVIIQLKDFINKFWNEESWKNKLLEELNEIKKYNEFDLQTIDKWIKNMTDHFIRKYRMWVI